MTNTSQVSGLTVRQHEREGIEVPVEFIVDQQHASQVRFSASSLALGPQTIHAQAMDISSGGMGLRSRVFVPRMCEGSVRIFAPGDSAGEREVLFENPVKVRRVILIGREPTYSLGLAFLNPDQDLDERLTVLFNSLAATSHVTVPTGDVNA